MSCTFGEKAKRAGQVAAGQIMFPMPMSPRENRGRTCGRPCGPYGAAEGSTQPRSCARIRGLRKRMLRKMSVRRPVGEVARDSRFSPVWLYMWVCSELGRVNLLSQTLHLCFFCVFDDTLELKEPIIDCGAGGMVPAESPEGLGRVRDGI